jgi:methionyl-tRNA formyltransferase
MMTHVRDMEVIFLGINDVGMRIYDWLCDREGVSVLALLTTDEQLSMVQREQPDMVVSVGFGHLVPDEILSVPTRGCINLHPALLPYNRGASPNVWSLVEGTPPGVTLHYMDAEFDTGDIIAQRRVEADFSDTGKDLHKRLEAAQYKLFTEVWPRIENSSIDASPQPGDAGTYHTVADFEDLCAIDPGESYRAKELLDILRALTFPPFDNAHLDIDGERYYVDVDIRPAQERSDDDHDGFLSAY